MPSSTEVATRLLSLYPVLAELPPAQLGEALATQAAVHALPEGKLLFEQGRPCAGFPLVTGSAQASFDKLRMIGDTSSARTVPLRLNAHSYH